MKRYPMPEEGISGHYFLQYFNVKSFGFLEPSVSIPAGETKRSFARGEGVPEQEAEEGEGERGR